MKISALLLGILLLSRLGGQVAATTATKETKLDASIAYHTHSVRGVHFYVPPNGKRCLAEDVYAHTPLSIDYELSEAPHQTASIHVTDSYGHVLSQREHFIAKKGHFTLTPEEYDTWEICVMADPPPSPSPTHDDQKMECRLLLRHGEAPKMDSAEEEKRTEELKSLEEQLQAVEELSLGVVPLAPPEEDSSPRLTFMFILLPLLAVICGGAFTLWLLRFLRNEKRMDLRR